jgi:rhodanese-related sulfurtransferase
MSINGPKQISLIAGADRHNGRGAWLTLSWQLTLVVLTAAALGLCCNQVRTTRLPLIGNWSPEAQLTTASGDSLAVALADAEGMYYAHSAVFLDARSPEVYDEGHIEGALNVPWENAPWDDFDAKLASTLRDFSTETTFIAYCDGDGCSLSRELAMAMLERGYTEVRVLVNGWTLWQDKRLPVHRGLAAADVR